MLRKNRVVALLALLCLPACTSKWVKLPVTTKLTVMDSDGDCGGVGCGPGGCPFVTKPSIPSGEVRVGYVYKNDDGTQPFPCWWYANYFLRGAVKFTLPASEPNSGITDGKLHYRATGVGGNPPCPVVRAAIATKPWSGESDFAITDDSEVFNQSIPLGQGIQTIQVPLVVLAKWYLGQQPNHGFVFLGADESGGHKATKSCLAILSDFELEIRRTKKKSP